MLPAFPAEIPQASKALRHRETYAFCFKSSSIWVLLG